jgi:serine/threonine protein kinase
VTVLRYCRCAIELDPSNAPLYCNRSMCRGALGDWAGSAQDAMAAVKLEPAYLKAHYRLVKAKIELGQLREAQYFLLLAYSACGESSKDLKPLEAEFQNAFGCSFKPKPTDFRMLEGLGEGNFSKIFKVEFKATKKIYAMKVIEKLGAEKIKRRHPNVHNEILMEKKILNMLSHPNIVILYSTCQDAEALYYQMEHCDGGEVWSLILDEKVNKMVGCPRSVARFVLAEALNAIEYMHQKGVLHRDLKPENMMLTSSGHLKLVDFGTCKDLVHTEFNGPQFVGTAEFMSPETIRSQKTGPATDLWSLGAVAFMLLYGYAPFIGASPYMTFLRIKRALLKMPFDPAFVPEEFEMLTMLLERDPVYRFALCTGTADSGSGSSSSKEVAEATPAKFVFTPEYPFSAISYDTVRRLPFFSSDPAWRAEEASLQQQAGGQTEPTPAPAPAPAAAASPAFLRGLVTRPARRVPLLSELCMRALKTAVGDIADAVSSGGGAPPQTPWMRRFDVFRLPPAQIAVLALQLQRCGRLHQPQGMLYSYIAI